ncbi:hypothetical protein [Enterococcus raffinosus]|uniref:hypothetical protein n=1 Tax=Enterococcus raffinosus TaxID=71452 RepID=UPI003DA521FA
MNQINNLAFDIMHKEMNPTEQFVYADKIYQLSLQPELNENQQVVLEWLKDDYKEYGDPIIAIGDLGDEILPSRWETCLQATYEKLDTQQKWEVLAAFAEWGKKEVAE